MSRNNDIKIVLLIVLLLILFFMLRDQVSRHIEDLSHKLTDAASSIYCALNSNDPRCLELAETDYTFGLPPKDPGELAAYFRENGEVLAASLQGHDVLDRMREGRFEELERYFNDVQSRYERGEINEYTYGIMMDHMCQGDDEGVELFTRWLQAIPDSYIAYAGRGATSEWIGWKKRGTKWAKDTPEENFQEMRRYHGQALDDLRQAVKIHPGLTWGYMILVKIGKNRGPTSLWLAESLKQDPYNRIVRSKYLDSLEPRWGGSHYEMHEFASSIVPLINKNGWLRSLLAKEYGDKAKIYRSAHQYSAAIKAITMAIYHNPNDLNYYRRAYTYSEMGDHVAALKDAEMGLHYYPEDTRLLYMYAYEARHLKQYAKADTAYSKLTVLNPNNAKYWYARGGMHYIWRKFDTAMEYLSKAYKLEPSSNLYLYWFALASVRNDQPTGLVLFRDYLERCKNQKCDSNNLKWTKDWVACVDGDPKCRFDEHDIIKWRQQPLYSRKKY